MNREFVLRIGRETSLLILMESGKTLGEKGWPEARDMGRKLFEAIRDLLAEAGLQAGDVPLFRIEADQDVLESSTSLRIAETVQKVYTFSVSRSHSSA